MATINEIMTAPLTQLQNMLQAMNSFNVQMLSQVQNGIMSAPNAFGSGLPGLPAPPQLPALPTFGATNGVISPVLPTLPINGTTMRTASTYRTPAVTTTKKVALEVM